LKHAQEFLKEGFKVKAYVFFKGRSILFKDQGEVLLARFANDLEDYAKVDQLPQLEGKRMIIMFSPKKQNIISDIFFYKLNIVTMPKMKTISGAKKGSPLPEQERSKENMLLKVTF